MLDRPMCLTFAINILVAMGTVTWRIPQIVEMEEGLNKDMTIILVDDLRNWRLQL